MGILAESDKLESQAYTLWSDITLNTGLAFSTVPALNKSLSTTNKKPIKAINEVNALVLANNATVINLKASVTSMLGDALADPTIMTKIKAIDIDALHAIVKIYNMLAGTGIEDISSVGGSVNNAILALNARLVTVETTPVSSASDGSFLLNF